MNNIIDYSKYNITSTEGFNKGLSELKHNGLNNEIKKLFKVIDEIIEDVDMYEAENARPLKINKEVIHIHLDGRRSGDIILLYRVSGHGLDLDLKLHNITNHRDMDRKASAKFINNQKLTHFDVISNKYSKEQLDFAETCFMELISDYKFYQTEGQERANYTNSYLEEFFKNFECSDLLTFDEFLQLIQHFSSKCHKPIFGSVNFSTDPMRTSCITEREERYILNLFEIYGLDIDDAYIEDEVDEYGDSYEFLRIETASNDFRSTYLLESELLSLDKLFDIHFESAKNGLGNWGKTYEFSHYFVE